MTKHTLAFLVFFFLIACKQKPSVVNSNEGLIIKVKAEKEETDSNESPEFILEVLRNRIQNKYPDYKTSVIYNNVSQTYIIELPYLSEEESDQARLLVSSKGQIKISESLPLHQIVTHAMDSIFNSNDTLKLLKIYDSSTMGAAAINDTSKINKFFKAERNRFLFPKNYNFELKWGYPLDSDYNQQQGLLPLYYIKKSSLNFTLNNACQKVEIDKYAHSRDEAYNQFINISLKTEYAQKFEKLTYTSIGLPLVISVDETVISAPTVHQGITGGNMTISGKFNYDLLKTFESILKNKIIETPLKIVSVKKTK